ncbi:response regulator [Roseovarius sp. B08]|uniref:response regulator n=1 Tax=Roseovarius sp. B08 TaxID=3449223 RepID=UPI003EDC359E
MLVVEDDQFICEDIACTLTECGFSVAGTVQTLDAAMRFVKNRRGQFDCVLLDIDLGGQSCQPLAASLEALDLPYALVTAHSKDVVRDLGYRAPVIEKPFQNWRLSAELSNLVAAARRGA